jgi:hypothetical protein
MACNHRANVISLIKEDGMEYDRLYDWKKESSP